MRKHVLVATWFVFTCLCFVLSSSVKEWSGGWRNAPAETGDNKKDTTYDSCFARRLLVVITSKKAKSKLMATMLNAALGTQIFSGAYACEHLAKVGR